MSDKPVPFGLYVHVPFCKALCHYCDFAKTANFSAGLASTYLERLGDHLSAWISSAAVKCVNTDAGAKPLFTSVFFGGGTPSLFTQELAPLFEKIAPYLAPGAEVSLEANPDDVTAEHCRTWRDLGVNRLSVGVQTFDASGLAQLKRVHGPADAERALGTAMAHFPSVNADLIYGWAHQNAALWRHDLGRVLASGVPHLSLYNLTYAEGTPIGRAVARGKLAPEPDERLAAYYDEARAMLGAAGFEHEEVSNWSKPGHTCRHNWLYWDAGPYVGIGAGAHGYLPQWVAPAAAPEAVSAGVRWDYGRNERRFLTPEADVTALSGSTEPAEYARILGCNVHASRTPEDWLLEYVGCGLRTTRGVDLVRIAHQTGLRLVPRPNLERAFAEGLVSLQNDVLRLIPSEWFRETSWSLEVILSLIPI